MDVNEKYLQVGERLKKLRGALSQQDFAKKIGVSLTAYQRYEYGERIPHPHVLSKIAELFGTTVDWILKGELNIEKAMILEWVKKSHYLEDLIETIEQINARILKLKIVEVKEIATEEELRKISEIIKNTPEDEKKFLDLLRKKIKEEIEQGKDVAHFEQISYRSPLYTMFHQIEKMFNKGERGKIEVIRAVLAAVESDNDERKILDAFKALVAVFESKF